MGITYAPPGPSSSITFTDTNYVGNTTDVTVQVSQSEKINLSATAGPGKESGGQSGGGSSIPILGWLQGAANLSATAGYESTQTTTNENSFTVSTQTSNSWQTGGTPNAFAPVDHDYDTVWLWLNPTLVVTADMSNLNAPIAWNGYGYDAADPTNAPDIYPVIVGWMNGHIAIPEEVTNYLARSWTSNESLFWPNGDSAALNQTDYANIAAADPFNNANYTVLFPSPCSSPCTTTDGRFTAAVSQGGSAEFVTYQQPSSGVTPNSQTYTETYATTAMSSSTNQNQTAISWGISATLTGTVLRRLCTSSASTA